MRKQRGSTGASSKKWKSRVLLGVVAASVTAFASLGVSFADVDLKEKLRFAMQSSADQVIAKMRDEIRTDTEAEKIVLQKELQAKLQEHQAALQAYAAEQKQAAIQAIKNRSRELVASREFSSEEQKRAYAESIQSVESRALAELSAITISEPIPPPPSVTVDVYAAPEQP